MNSLKSFVSIGAGNVAYHLCGGLTEKGFILKQVFSRTKESGQYLSSKFHTKFTTSISEIFPDADFYIVSVSDNAITSLLSELQIRDKLIMHTSGSMGINIFQNKFPKCGILYPVQTFSKNTTLDLSGVPFIIEGSEPEIQKSIMFIAGKLSNVVHVMESSQIKLIHIAAVIACNFTNYMYSSAYELLKDTGIDFKLLFPLMEETLKKAKSGNPASFQTGPARRGDSNIINEHIKTLSFKPDLQKFYTFISDNIRDYFTINHHKKNKDE